MENELRQYSSEFSFQEQEKVILKFWKEKEIYKKIVEKNKKGPIFNFIDGPPFVSSDSLHIGHILISSGKSSVLNYYQMLGYNVCNKLGFDVHGIPTEHRVSKLLNLMTPKDVEKFGIANYNKKCKEVIQSYSGAWQGTFDRVGRFLNYNNEYKTLDLKFMESVWWVFKQLWDKGLVYKGYRVMPYSTGCNTALSNFEASGIENYKEVIDPTAYVKFKLIDEDCYLIAWTTTPWTLPCNLALCVHPKLKYIKIHDMKNNEDYIISEKSLDRLYSTFQKNFKTLGNLSGESLIGRSYQPQFDFFSNRNFKIIGDDFVKEDEGTGIVHIAPAFGNDDFETCLKNNIINRESANEFCPVDENGCYTQKISPFQGMYVRDANMLIIEDLKKRGLLFKKEMYKHNYPFCWRTDTPLIYKLVSSVFIKVTDLKEKLLKNNKKINWIPENVGTGRFHQWLDNVKDWGVSRTRFFGTPLPLWISDDEQEIVCIGSLDELKKLAGLSEVPKDIHKEFIDEIKIPSQKGGSGMLKNIGLVFDCWFESGCVPYGQLHYPFENKDFFDDKEYLGDFVLEGIDQTRGWFYTLLVLSTALFDKPPFKNVICAGLILDEKGHKISKKLGNFIPPVEIFDQFGADATRMYLLSSPAILAEAFKFRKEDIANMIKKFIQILNANKFFIEYAIKLTKEKINVDFDAYKKSSNPTDCWMQARIGSFISFIQIEMGNYRLNKIWSHIHNFIEDLTNWYLKFNRNRLKGRFCTKEDQMAAFSTLFLALLNFAKISAPFIPFLAETLYQYLKPLLPIRSPDSVHLNNYPSASEFLAV